MRPSCRATERTRRGRSGAPAGQARPAQAAPSASKQSAFKDAATQRLEPRGELERSLGGRVAVGQARGLASASVGSPTSLGRCCRSPSCAAAFARRHVRRRVRVVLQCERVASLPCSRNMATDIQAAGVQTTEALETPHVRPVRCLYASRPAPCSRSSGARSLPCISAALDGATKRCARSAESATPLSARPTLR